MVLMGIVDLDRDVAVRRFAIANHVLRCLLSPSPNSISGPSNWVITLTQRAAPAGPTAKADYAAAEHVTVRYEDGRGLDIDDMLAAAGIDRRFVAIVPGFAGIAALLQGGPWLATLPARLAGGVLRGLARAPVPWPTPPMPMYAVWHRRQHEDPAHRWLREQLDAVVAALPAA
jgi:DNA-binding transcriptional LysR family regulator